MTLAEPAFLLLLLLVPALALAAWLAEKQRRNAWHQLVAPRLRHRLAAPSSSTARWLSLGCGFLALVLIIFSLAQPNAGAKESVSLVRGRNIIIALDASRSMLVKDVAPDRLTAGKAVVYDLLDNFPEDRIGLLGFAGSATLQAPLTVDHNALRETLEQFDTSNIPSGGSNLAEAVYLATKTFKETGQKKHGLIVISDGELHEGELEAAASDARRAGVFVVTVGLGSLEGDFVPDPEESDGRFRDRSGNPVLSRLNPAPLRTLANDTSGLYLEGAGSSFAKKMETVISRLDAFGDEGRVELTPLPRFQWFLIPAIILMIASLLIRFLWVPARPQAVPAPIKSFALGLGLLLLSSPRSEAQDGFLDRVGQFLTRDFKAAQGSQSLTKQDPEKALEYYQQAATSETGERLLKTHFGEAMAHYQMGDYDKAADAFSKSLLSEDKTLQRDSHFQLANTLYHRGQEAQNAGEPSQDDNAPLPSSLLEDALKNYEAALEVDPEHQQSKDNQAFVKKALEEMKQQEQEQQQQQEEQQQDGEGEENEEKQDGEESSENQEQENGEENQEGEEGQEEQEGQNEESGESGENGEEEQEDQSGQESGEEDEEQGEEEGQQPQPGEESQEQQGQQGQAQHGEEQSPREDETSEEFARRILQENADFQKDALRQHRRQQQPTKDW